MSSIKIQGNALPNMPWQDRPAGCNDPLWRYSANPVIPRDLLPDSNSIFNSAVVPFEGGFAGVFRCDDKNRRMTLHAGFSKDGFKWDINPETIKFEGADPEIGEWVYGYDPRVAKIEDKFYVTWCNGYHGPTIGVAWTTDFKTFHQLENAFLPYNRNGVLFPKKINGKFALLSRPSDTGHTAFGDIFLLRITGYGILGTPPSRDGTGTVRGKRLAVHENRRRPGSYRDFRRMAAVLPRRTALMQRICLRIRFSTPRPGTAMEGNRTQRTIPHLPS